MFEALMVPLLVPEERWGPRSWGVNHPLYVRPQIEHGLRGRLRRVGILAVGQPAGGYSAHGVGGIGMNPDGYPSDNDSTFVDHGFGDCRPARPDPPPSAYTTAWVTPHASFPALRFAPHAALANLATLRSRSRRSTGRAGPSTPSTCRPGRWRTPTWRSTRAMVMAAATHALTAPSVGGRTPSQAFTASVSGSARAAGRPSAPTQARRRAAG